MSPHLFYRDQADQQQVAADNATLENVRNRSQRASNAWAVLATRSERAENARAKSAAEKLLDSVSENPDRGVAAA